MTTITVATPTTMMTFEAHDLVSQYVVEPIEGVPANNCRRFSPGDYMDVTLTFKVRLNRETGQFVEQVETPLDPENLVS
jgi:hypothetical protein